jgi:hypothetical protein
MRWTVYRLIVASLVVVVACDFETSNSYQPDIQEATDAKDDELGLSTGEIERICLFATQCFRWSMIGNISTCATSIRHAQMIGNTTIGMFGMTIEQMRKCAVESADCESYRTCSGVSYGPSYCHDHPFASYDNGVAVSCSGSSDVANLQDCAKWGPSIHCESDPSGQATCTSGVPCSDLPDGVNGPFGFGGIIMRCLDNVVLYCNGMYDVWAAIAICPDEAPCVETTYPTTNGGTSMYASCHFGVTPCTPMSERCEGGKAISCHDPISSAWNSAAPSDPSRAIEVVMDCAGAGEECVIMPRTDGTKAYCVPVKSDCDASFQGGCSGSNVVACIDGESIAIDCGQLGKTSCVIDGVFGARCE